jgi:hypothetical protein
VHARAARRPATCSSADADFDTLLRLWSPSCVLVAENDDSCGSGRSEAVFRATESGPHVVEVTGSEARDVGRFTLGWFGEWLDFDCADPLAVLETPTTACRTVAGSMSCGEISSYAVTLVQGQAHTFTLCDATCAGAFVDSWTSTQEACFEDFGSAESEPPAGLRTGRSHAA